MDFVRPSSFPGVKAFEQLSYLFFYFQEEAPRRTLLNFLDDIIELDRIVLFKSSVEGSELVNELRGSQTLKRGCGGAVLDRHTGHLLQTTPGATQVFAFSFRVCLRSLVIQGLSFGNILMVLVAMIMSSQNLTQQDTTPDETSSG